MQNCLEAVTASSNQLEAAEAAAEATSAIADAASEDAAEATATASEATDAASAATSSVFLPQATKAAAITAAKAIFLIMMNILKNKQR